MKPYLPIFVPVSAPTELFPLFSRRTLYSYSKHFITSTNFSSPGHHLRHLRFVTTNISSARRPPSLRRSHLPLTSAYSLPLYTIPIPIGRAFCSNSHSNYELNFDHNIPVLELKQMIINQKVDYDYPIYWSNSRGGLNRCSLVLFGSLPSSVASQSNLELKLTSISVSGWLQAEVQRTALGEGVYVCGLLEPDGDSIDASKEMPAGRGLLVPMEHVLG